jgi:two-component system, OmpR family, phosphate regulon sensor histidine kinase PhoR
MPSPIDKQILELMARPALFIKEGLVAHANHAALNMLGSHIVGQDVRLAMRQPDAVALVMRNEPGHVRVAGLSTKGSLWDISSHFLDNGLQLVTLENISGQASIARAHADFVANASHELRTPLASVLGYIETLKDPKAGESPETRERFLNIIKHEAERMQALVGDLMSLSRIEAIKHEAPTEMLNIVAISRGIIGEAYGDVKVETSHDEIYIRGDRGQIAQAVRNLVDNAIKYGGDVHPVLIKLETTKTGWVTIEVADKGDGIAAEHLPRLTERFYRVDAGRSRKVGGTGLGLSIVKHIIERHRGRFDIKSRPGEGTTASIMMQLAEDN